MYLLNKKNNNMEIKKIENIKNICNFLIKYSIYAIAFLVPLFFLPFTAEAFDFNKQAILVLFAFVSVFAWMIKFLISGKTEVKASKIYWILGAFLFIVLLSTIFSVYPAGSFWGWPLQVSEGFVSVMALCILFFLISNSFSKKDAYLLLIILISSLALCNITAIAVLIWPKLLMGGINTIGSVGGLAGLNAILLPLLIILLATSAKLSRILFFIALILSAVILILTNYFFVWWVILASSAILVAIGIFKKDLFDTRWLAVPMFFLAISLFFIILSPQIDWLSQRMGGEIYLTQKTSVEIGLKTLKESPVLGSGPGTFSYDFLKHKPKEINSFLFFGSAGSKVLTLFSTIGVFGVFAFLTLIGFVVFLLIKELFFNNKAKEDYLALILGLFASTVSLLVFYFIYGSGLVIDLFCFLLLAIVIAFVVEKKKVYELKQGSAKMLTAVLLFIIIFVACVSFLIFGGQRYYANINYTAGLAQLQKGDIDKAIVKLERAVILNKKNDAYLSQLAQAYIFKIQKTINDSNIVDEDKTKAIQMLVGNAINASKMAVDYNPKSSNSWSILAFVYQNLVGFSSELQELAENSYKTAISFSVHNPYLETQLGVIYYQKDNYNEALAQFEKAKAINSSYETAIYYAGLTYDKLNQKDKAIVEFEKLSQIYPKAEDLKTIINNLKAGKPALESPAQPAPTPEPTPANPEPPVVE